VVGWLASQPDSYFLTSTNPLLPDVFCGLCVVLSPIVDIRQNPNIGEDGYNSILEALEHNHGLWCSVMVDSHRFQGLFNLLIELNQAGRGDLLRSPSLAKLGTFMGELHDPTALWFFLRIHDTIRDPLVAFLQWKSHIVRSKQGGNTEDETTIQQWPAKRARTEAS
jgi:hypothetical protein